LAILGHCIRFQALPDSGPINDRTAGAGEVHQFEMNKHGGAVSYEDEVAAVAACE